jgi:hypothetical protein
MTNERASSPAVVNLEFELQLADVEQGLQALPRARLSRFFSWLSVAGVVAIVAWRWHEGRDPGVLVIVAIFLIGILVVGRDPAKRIAKRVFDALPIEARRLQLRIDDEGIHLGTGDTQSQLSWGQVIRVMDSKRSFLLFASRTEAQIIPKRGLTSEQIGIIRALVAQRVTPQGEPWLTPEILRRTLIYGLIIAALWLVYQYFHTG